MAEVQTLKSSRESGGKAAAGCLFVLDLSSDRIVTMNPDGSGRKIIVTDCRFPDGIAVDVDAGHIYWTNMGVPNLNDGSIERGRSRRAESQGHRSKGRHVHAKAASSR